MNIAEIRLNKFIEQIDFDYWCNAKIDIIIKLIDLGEVNSISEMARLINRSFSVTHKHVSDLSKKGIITISKDNKHSNYITLTDRRCALKELIKK